MRAQPIPRSPTPSCRRLASSSLRRLSIRRTTSRTADKSCLARFPRAGSTTIASSVEVYEDIASKCSVTAIKLSTTAKKGVKCKDRRAGVQWLQNRSKPRCQECRIATSSGTPSSSTHLFALSILSCCTLAILGSMAIWYMCQAETGATKRPVA